MRMTRVARPLAKVGYLGVLLTSAGFFCLPVGLRAQAVAVPAPVSVPPPVATLAAGDALEVKIQTQAALDVYLQLEKGGRQDAELLYRIAREYAELMQKPRKKKNVWAKLLWTMPSDQWSRTGLTPSRTYRGPFVTVGWHR